MALFNPFAGEISRGRWWLLQFVIFGLAFIMMVITIMILADPNAPVESRNSEETMALWGIIIAVIYMNFSTCMNRLRHSGRTRWLYLAFLLPLVGTGLMLYFCGIEAGPKQSQFQTY